MADEEAQVEAEDGQEDEPTKRKLPKLVLVGVAALVLIGGGAGAAWFMGFFGGGGGDYEDVAEATEAKPSFYYDLPEMVVNLNSPDKKQRYLKVRVSLEMSDENVVQTLRPVEPRLMDAFQVYLRELRSTDLDGSAGMHRLKEELTRRVNIAIYPRSIDTVLFREIIVQ
ncbi:flagellar basal body-associated FliL family protein [Tepidamorphus sp. 3E244]|uniref:flagellar basal body-associated FliL family protein n=1 Tax=Tepidamorphus sp. 3E244 TaxID=3385498 RepID=UPI0038FC05A7